MKDVMTDSLSANRSDTDLTVQFIEVWVKSWSPDWWLNLCSIRSSGVQGRSWRVGDIKDAESSIKRWIEQENASGANVYFTYNPVKGEINTKPRKDDIVKIVAFGLDIDPPHDDRSYQDRAHVISNLAQRLRAGVSELPLGALVHSGHGLNVFFLPPEPIDLEERTLAEGICKQLHMKIGATAKTDGTWNADRLMRLPGTLNWATSTKLTKGYPNEPVMAKTLECRMAHLTLENLAHLVPAGEAGDPEVNERGPSTRSETSDEPYLVQSLLKDWGSISSARTEDELYPQLSEKLAAAMARKPKLEKRWQGSKEGLGDTSRSGLLMSLVAYLKWAGFTVEEAVRVAWVYPFGDLNDRKKYPEPTDSLRAFARAWLHSKTNNETGFHSARFNGLPIGYAMLKDGLYHVTQSAGQNQAPKYHWLMACHEIKYECAYKDGTGQGLVIEWLDGAENRHVDIIDRFNLHKDFATTVGTLAGSGLRCAASQHEHNLIREYFVKLQPEIRVLAVGQGGWHDNSFVLADGTFFGDSGQRVILRPEASVSDHSTAKAGTLEDWQQHVARLAVGNSRIAVGICAAFAGPLLDIVGEESGGIHLVGKSRSGKTTVSRCAASVWGRGDSKGGAIRQWRATSNGLEGIAAATSDSILILDEIGQAKAEELLETIYMLANESGKQRADRTGAARTRRTWRSMFLSTGEMTVGTRLAEVRRAAPAGLQVRLVDLSADAGAGMGVFENLYEFKSAAALAEHLRQMTQKYYGTAIRCYLENLTRLRFADSDSVKQFVESIQHEFVQKHLPTASDGQLRTVARRFGLIAAAGELAVTMKLLPWEEGEGEEAAAKCFHAWLSERGTLTSSEDQQALRQVREFILSHGESRFEEIAGSSGRINNRAGWKRSDDDKTEYLIHPDAWKAEVCKGIDPKLAAKVLSDRGLLRVGDGGYQRKESVPGQGRIRVYVVTGDILDAD